MKFVQTWGCLKKTKECRCEGQMKKQKRVLDRRFRLDPESLGQKGVGVKLFIYLFSFSFIYLFLIIHLY